MEPNRPDPSPAGQTKPPLASPPETPKPIFTKALGSLLCGLLSMPTCFCFGAPSIALGALAIWLGIYVKKNFRGNTASELANLYALVGIITGGIGILLGVISLIFVLFFGGLSALSGAAS